MVGGSAAAYYARGAYRSDDLDFVVAFEVKHNSPKVLTDVMESMGYELRDNIFHHTSGNPFTVEFPKGPLAVGGDYLTDYDTVRRGEETLFIITPADSVRDRLAHYYHWGDGSALRAAILIARAERGRVNIDNVKDWSQRENALDKFNEFRRLLSESGP